MSAATPSPPGVTAAGSAEGEIPSGARAPPDARNSAARRVRVTVVAEATGAPIPAAHLRAYRNVSDPAGLRVLCDSELIAHGTADGEGACELLLPAGGRPFTVVASAEGHQPGERELGDEATKCEIRLARGLEIRGTVTDPGGFGVADVRVRARHQGLPSGALALGAAPDCAGTWQTATTDATGRFAFRALGPGMYHLIPFGDGIETFVPRGTAALDVTPIVAAGTQDARLMITEILMLRVRIVDARSGHGISRRFPRIEASPLDGVHLLQPGNLVSLWNREGWFDPDSGAVGGGEYTGWVRRGTGGSLPEATEVTVAIPGYRPARASNVRLRRPSVLLKDRIMDEVKLIPEPGFERAGRVLGDCAREHGRWWRAPWRLLGVESAAGLDAEIYGTRLDGDRWEFLGVPSGRRTLTIWDGLSYSEPVEVEVPESGATTIRPTFEAPTGFTLELRDEADHPLFDADTVWVVEQDRAADRHAGALASRELTRLHPNARGDPLLPVEPREPGTYSVEVSVPGFDVATTVVEVKPGTVMAVIVRLQATK